MKKEIKKMTMADISKLAGVTKTTVSRYFNGGYVKKETKERIKKIIEEYNYAPNIFARLKAKQTYTIGVISPSLRSFISGIFLTGVEKTLRENNYIPIIMNTNHNTELEIQYIEKLLRLKVDGIILSATEITEAHKNIIKTISIPIVFFGQEVENAISIANNDYNAGKEVGEYIGYKNHKNIGIITVSEKDYAIGVIRRNGILDGLKKYNSIENIYIEESDFSMEKSEIAIINLLEKDIDAVICSTDRQAFAVYKVLESRNIVIGKEISVVAFGNYDVSEILQPKLSSVEFDTKNAGIYTANTLIKLINKEEVQNIYHTDYKFIKRESIKL